MMQVFVQNGLQVSPGAVLEDGAPVHLFFLQEPVEQQEEWSILRNRLLRPREQCGGVPVPRGDPGLVIGRPAQCAPGDVARRVHPEGGDGFREVRWGRREVKLTGEGTEAESTWAARPRASTSASSSASGSPASASTIATR